jgi:hypothetical protein
VTGAGESFERRLRPVLATCSACHFRPGIHSVLSREPDLFQLRLRDVRRDLVPAADDAREADLTKRWKLRQESWRLLRELWEQAAGRRPPSAAKPPDHVREWLHAAQARVPLVAGHPPRL